MADEDKFRKEVTQPFMRIRRAMEDKPWIEILLDIKSPLAAAPLRLTIELSDMDLADSWSEAVVEFRLCAQRYRRLDRRSFVPNRTAFATQAYNRLKECRRDLRKDTRQRMIRAVEKDGTHETGKAPIASSMQGSLSGTPQVTLGK